jgi:CRISPR-associated protein Cst1
LLFDREGERSDRLPMELWARSGDAEKVARHTLVRWRALCRLYVEVMYEMDPDRIKPVAELLASWIAQESPRGRFNEYRRAAGSGYELHKLLMTAGARLYLDGRTQRFEPELLGDLLASGSQGWRERTLLFFEVIEALHNKKVVIGATSSESADEDSEEIRFDTSNADEGEEYA